MCCHTRSPTAVPLTRRCSPCMHVILQLSILPFDLVGFFLDNSSVSQLKVLRVIRLMRLMKLVRIAKATRYVADCLAPLPPRKGLFPADGSCITTIVLNRERKQCSSLAVGRDRGKNRPQVGGVGVIVGPSTLGPVRAHGCAVALQDFGALGTHREHVISHKRAH